LRARAGSSTDLSSLAPALILESRYILTPQKKSWTGERADCDFLVKRNQGNKRAVSLS